MSRFIFRLQVVGATTAFMLRDWTRIPNTVSDNFKSNGFGIHNMHSFIQSIILVLRASVSVFEWVTQLRNWTSFRILRHQRSACKMPRMLPVT